MPNVPTIPPSASTTQKALRLAAEKKVRQVLQFAFDRGRDILLELLAHMVARELTVDPDEEGDDPVVVRDAISANSDAFVEPRHFSVPARSSI
jgi:hypothetical protein